MMTIYPHGFITIRKIEKMVDDPKHWQVFAENKITKERIPLKDRNDLREYGFYWDYEICYTFSDDWGEYTKKNEDGLIFDWKKFDIEISVTRKDDKIIAEIVKWQDNKPSAEDLPSCFMLAYWNEYNDLKFIGANFFKNVPFWLLPTIYMKIKNVQKLLENLSREKED